MRSQPLGVMAALVLLLFFVVAVAAPYFAPDDPLVINATQSKRGPSLEHWMGTDQYGRDLYSRVIYGSRVSMIVAVVPVLLGAAVGAAYGLVSGAAGGWIDAVLQRTLDAIMAFPALVLLLIIVSAFGTDFSNVLAAIAVLSFPVFARVARGSVLATRKLQYVEAARVIGASEWRVATRHVLPNVIAPLIVVASGLSGSAVLAEAGLSYLGFGIQPPDPSWGNMLSGDARTYFLVAPWLAIFPGLAIAILVLAFNLLGDTTRDFLDPRANKGHLL